MFNGSEKVPKTLAVKIDKLKTNISYKNNVKELLNYIAGSDIYNASFVEGFNLYFGDSYASENLILYFTVDKSRVVIGDENISGDSCKMFFQFTDYAKELRYDLHWDGGITASLTSSKEIKVLKKALEEMANNKSLIYKYNVKKLTTRQERINLKIEEILSRKINLS